MLKRSLCALTATCVLGLAASPAFAADTKPLKVLLVGDSLMVGAKV